ncbi:MAG: hypothetical protein ING29_11355 [Azospirillum sp.]|nr:hypothetical protein [Azospirillum sp.]
MNLAELRASIVEIDKALKSVIPDAWAMMVLSEGGHIQFSLNRRQHWPISTFDVPANAEDWQERVDEGVATMSAAIAEVRRKRERGEL